MSFNSISKQYIAELQEMYRNNTLTGDYTVELSFRPALDKYFYNLISSIDTNIVKILEPKKQNQSGRPDWKFYNRDNYGVYGYVEAKGLNIGETIKYSEHQVQINKYLQIGHKVILTDGIDFCFFNSIGGEPRIISLIKKPINKADWTKCAINIELENAFRVFFAQPNSRICKEKELITDVAKRARLLADNVLFLNTLNAEEAMNEDEKNTILILKALQETIVREHDGRLINGSIFADFVAQVLSFALLYAHMATTDENDNPQDKFDKITKYWKDIILPHASEHIMGPFYELIELLKDHIYKEDTLLGTWYQDIIHLLSFVRLQNEQVQKPSYHELYEQFLVAYDPQTRFDYGAFYTPKELASYMIRVVEYIAHNYLGETNLYDNVNKLIDPCCGTGTFLELLVRSAEVNHSNPFIAGLEIMPAPYALAHYRMTQLMRELNRDINYSISLTNTLSDSLVSNNQIKDSLFANEKRAAYNAIKTPLTLIIGNPPSSDSFKFNQGQDFSSIIELMNDFRPPVELRRNRQNTQHQSTNPFMQFLRWTCDKAKNTLTNSIVSIVVPSTFAENDTYRYARKWLAENFCKVMIVDVDLDARVGVRNESLFHTLQGRTVLFCVRKEGRQNTTNTIEYKSYSHLTKAEKLERLSNEVVFNDFEVIDLDTNAYNFRPQKEFDKDLYERFWKVSDTLNMENGIFQRYCSGIKLAPTHFFVHANGNILKRRMKEFIDLRIPVEDFRTRWFEGQTKGPKIDKLSAISNIINSLKISGVTYSEDKIKDYTFRPFVNMKIVLWEQLLKRLSREAGGGTRSRPEIINTFNTNGCFGIAIAHSPKDQCSELKTFTSFCWTYPDNDLVRRGNAYIYCNKFPGYDQNETLPTNNINNNLLDTISAKLEVEKIIAADMIVYYTYAVLSSQHYLDTFEGALFTVNSEETRIRVPITSNTEAFKKLSALGNEAAELQKPGRVASQDKLNDYYSSLILVKSERGFKLKKAKYNNENETLCLYDTEGVKLIVKCRRDIYELVISGYQVIDYWIKFNCYEYTRQDFGQDFIFNFLDLIYKLEKYIDIITQIDEIILEVLKGEDLITSPS